jgi:hypothetical protein
MGRQVVTEEDIVERSEAGEPSGLAGDLAAVAPTRARNRKLTPDDYQGRLLKYIPAEVVAVYVFLDGVLRSAAPGLPIPIIRWVVFVALLGGTWLYLQRVEEVSRVQQLLISTVAFVIWVFSLGGPFMTFGWYSPLYGAILLPLYTFSIPIFQPRNKKK